VTRDGGGEGLSASARVVLAAAEAKAKAAVWRELEQAQERLVKVRESPASPNTR
jgi:hypothetical protein